MFDSKSYGVGSIPTWVTGDFFALPICLLLIWEGNKKVKKNDILPEGWSKGRI